MIIQIGMDDEFSVSVHVYKDVEGTLVEQDWGFFFIDDFNQFIEFLNNYTEKEICSLEFDFAY